MIFKSPPYNPWHVVDGESEYIAWTVCGQSKKDNLFSNRCMSVAACFPDKTFIQFQLGSNNYFAQAYGLTQENTVIYCNKNVIFWTKHNPSSADIQKQAKMLGKRRGTFDLQPEACVDSSQQLGSPMKTNSQKSLCEESNTIVSLKQPRLYKVNIKNENINKSIGPNVNMPLSPSQNSGNIRKGNPSIFKSMRAKRNSKSSLVSETSNISSNRPRSRSSSISKIKRSASNLLRRLARTKAIESDTNQQVRTVKTDSISSIQPERISNKSRTPSINSEEKDSLTNLPTVVNSVKRRESLTLGYNPKNRESTISILNYETIKPDMNLNSLMWYARNCGKNSPRHSIAQNAHRLSEYIAEVESSKRASNSSSSTNGTCRRISNSS